MSSEAREKPGFWETVRLLLGVARRRSDGRIKRQQHAFYSSSGGGSGSLRLGKVGFVLTALFMVVLNMAAAWLVGIAVATGERLEVQRQGKIVVSSRFLEEATAAENQTESSSPPTERTHVPLDYFSEARKIADENGGDSETIEQQLRTAFQQDGTNDFVAGSKADQWGLAGLTRSGRLSAMLGSWMLIAWFAMLVCQGEGLDLDLQRRRDPIWE